MSNETAAQLRALKLHSMAQTWPELLAQARHKDFAPEAFMQALLKAEIAERAVRSINYQMTAARFPAHRGSSICSRGFTRGREPSARTVSAAASSFRVARRCSRSASAMKPACSSSLNRSRRT
ncbi:ATP-binding protein [Burkholderia sp. BCC0419]|uniref:ATP-binding protein n=1 Tax=Burkholderia sp. BCC0419 TaxID=486878 RepID=UPI001FC87633|nr:ATP-binding protein [Burkholderia sp. BCC0419]